MTGRSQANHGLPGKAWLCSPAAPGAVPELSASERLVRSPPPAPWIRSAAAPFPSSTHHLQSPTHRPDHAADVAGVACLPQPIRIPLLDRPGRYGVGSTVRWVVLIIVGGFAQRFNGVHDEAAERQDIGGVGRDGR
jgi:hypothetical protein